MLLLCGARWGILLEADIEELGEYWQSFELEGKHSWPWGFPRQSGERGYNRSCPPGPQRRKGTVRAVGGVKDPTCWVLSR